MKNLPVWRPCLALALVLQTNGALAEQSPSAAAQQASEEDELTMLYGDSRSVSIATGNSQPLRRAPAVASVITAQDIAALGATDLDQVLETVPGLHVSRNASVYAPLYVIRGVYSRFTPQTLILQNGIPMTTMYTGEKGYAWGGLPLENVARIEIIRGPGSALYGADAFAGVINIITKTAADVPGTQVGAGAGSFNTWNTWLQHGGKMGALDVAFYLNASRTDGFKRTIAADAMTRNDTLFGTRASLAPGNTNLDYKGIDAALDLAYDKWRLRAGYKQRGDMGTGAGIASSLDPVGKAESERITADLSWSDPQFSQNWEAGALGSYLHYADLVAVQYRLHPPGVKFPTGPAFESGMIGAPERWERLLRLSAFATYTGAPGHRLRFGIGHDDLNLYKTREYKNFTFTPSGVPVRLPEVIDFSNSSPFMVPQRRKLDYVYVQDEWNFAKDWALTAGVRRDHFSDFGTTTNPRLALVWDASYDLTAKLLYGSAFRAPAFLEEYSINNPVARGNPSLSPETIQTVEAAFAWQARPDLEVKMNVFRYRMTDIIRAVANATPGTGATYANTGGQTGSGLEMDAVWDLNRDLRLSGNYAYQQSTDQLTRTDAGYAPHHHVNARLDWRFESGWMFTPQLNHVAGRKRPAGDSRTAIADYTTVDLTVSTRAARNQWKVSASVRNLFNADVREPSPAPGLALPKDLPMAPRAVWVQAVYTL